MSDFRKLHYSLGGSPETFAAIMAFASGTLTEGGDVKQAPGASLSGPPAASGDAQPLSPLSKDNPS